MTLEVENLNVSYGRKRVLSDVSFAVEEGDFVLISGPSGCGKSTLALALSGLIPHAKRVNMSGSVKINGTDTRDKSVAALACSIGIVFQNPACQLFCSTVQDEVSFAPRNRVLSGGILDEEELARRTLYALAGTGILHLREKRLHELSDGERQRVAIASVLSMRPGVLVLDEPTANLDWEGTELVMETLSRLNREAGITILIIEHRLSAVYPYCSKAMIMNEGTVAAFGISERVFSDKRRLMRLGLRFPWRWVENGTQRYVPEGISQPPGEGEPLVTLEGISAGYGKRRVFSDIDLSIYPSEFVALVGKNGAGKSTLARVIAGMHRKKRGTIRWHPSVRRLPSGRRVGFLFQNTGEQLLCGSVDEEVSLGPECFGLDGALVERALSATDLLRLGERSPRTLSMGEAQRCVLAAACASDPVLYILDEPSVGQDWEHLSRMMGYLRGLRKKGKAVLLITHDDKLVCRFAERIVLLEEGRIIADGVPRKSSPQRMTAVY
ncbi:MAG: energy-coupling factor ABC transporter ATP-binding protein [Spirochaetes bacterium]|nr:energy-coupling factor ABC transporter ATP-binding protein [Spirochaetota bacterium]